MRKFKIGDKIICSESGVVGVALRFYNPTACEEQTLVKSNDGREYHAPTSTWELYDGKNRMQGLDSDFDAFRECTNMVEQHTNAYGEYALKFAQNHGISLSEAFNEPMVKARLEVFNKTGV